MRWSAPPLPTSRRQLSPVLPLFAKPHVTPRHPPELPSSHKPNHISAPHELTPSPLRPCMTRTSSRFTELLSPSPPPIASATYSYKYKGVGPPPPLTLTTSRPPSPHFSSLSRPSSVAGHAKRESLPIIIPVSPFKRFSISSVPRSSAQVEKTVDTTLDVRSSLAEKPVYEDIAASESIRSTWYGGLLDFGNFMSDILAFRQPAQTLFLLGFIFGPWCWLFGGWLVGDDGLLLGDVSNPLKYDPGCACHAEARGVGRKDSKRGRSSSSSVPALLHDSQNKRATQQNAIVDWMEQERRRREISTRVESVYGDTLPTPLVSDWGRPRAHRDLPPILEIGVIQAYTLPPSRSFPALPPVPDRYFKPSAHPPASHRRASRPISWFIEKEECCRREGYEATVWIQRCRIAAFFSGLLLLGTTIACCVLVVIHSRD